MHCPVPSFSCSLPLSAGSLLGTGTTTDPKDLRHPLWVAAALGAGCPRATSGGWFSGRLMGSVYAMAHQNQTTHPHEGSATLEHVGLSAEIVSRVRQKVGTEEAPGYIERSIQRALDSETQ